MPLYHPLFMVNVYRLLQATCLYCHHFKMPDLAVSDHVSLEGSLS